jgi:DNA-binding transcriptional LysR family regulator
MVWTVDLQRLRSLVEAARLGSFAAAAQALGYTAPAVSQHVALLERELGCELLIRGARGVRPTPAGEVLRSRAERLLADAHLAELAVHETAGQLRSLRVGAFPSAAQHLLPDALEQLRSAHPDLELTLLHFEPPDGLTQLAAGNVDAVVTHRYPGVTWSVPIGVRLQTVLDDRLNLMIPATHRLGGQIQIEIGELQGEVFVSGTADDPNRIALELACATARFAPRIAFETTDYAVTATLVTKGFGIALVPELAWPPASEHSLSSVQVKGLGEPITRQISLAHRTSEHSPLVRELLANLRTAREQRGQRASLRTIGTPAANR